MTPKQILDSFSETLLRDERILSPQERALVTTLLQHVKNATGENQQIQEAVRAVIASAVGEIVAQRAFGVLGSSIVERILESGTSASNDSSSIRAVDIYAGPGPKDPQTPGMTPAGAPQPPKDPQSPGTPLRTPAVPPPPAPDPQSPGHGLDTTIISGHTAIAERPESLPARCVVLDEFLAPEELFELTRFAIEHEADFQASELISPTTQGGVVNYEHRRSRVLMNLERHQEVMLERIKTVLPDVLQKLGMEEFKITGVEAQITASNDGDYFHFHSDNASDRVASRHLTFVYFFHREPRRFEGGELQIHDARLEAGQYVTQGSYQTVVPQQNQIVFFPCELMHEITPVKCPSQLFADSRFTLNGWLRR